MKYALANKIKFSDIINEEVELAKLIRKRKQEVLSDQLYDYGFI